MNLDDRGGSLLACRQDNWMDLLKCIRELAHLIVLDVPDEGGSLLSLPLLLRPHFLFNLN